MKTKPGFLHAARGYSAGWAVLFGVALIGAVDNALIVRNLHEQDPQ